MTRTVADPLDVLLAYDPGVVTLDDQASPLEVARGGAALGEMSGDSDAFYEDFTSGLREYVTARREAAGFFFGGRGADPSAVVLGLDFSDDGGDDHDRLPPSPGRAEGGDLLAFTVPVARRPDAEEGEDREGREEAQPPGPERAGGGDLLAFTAPVARRPDAEEGDREGRGEAQPPGPERAEGGGLLAFTTPVARRPDAEEGDREGWEEEAQPPAPAEGAAIAAEAAAADQAESRGIALLIVRTAVGAPVAEVDTLLGPAGPPGGAAPPGAGEGPAPGPPESPPPAEGSESPTFELRDAESEA